MYPTPTRALALLPLLASGCLCRPDPDRPPAVEQDGQRYVRCGRVTDDRGHETIEVGTVRLERRGHEVTLLGDGDGRSRFGVLAGVEGWGEQTRRNVLEVVAGLRAEGAEAIIVAGGIALDREGCAEVLRGLAASGLPVLPVIGATAEFAAYRQAVAEVRRDHPHVIDLTVSRLVHWDNVDLVSLPGYHNPFYLRSRRGGCSFQRPDIRDLGRLVDRARAPVLLVAADAPRGRARTAVDLARGGVNIGSPLLAGLLEEGRVPFGLFGHVYESGGRATADVAGRRPVAEGVLSPTLYLNPGAIEAVPYDLADGGRSQGMGALLEVGPEGARYRVLRVGDGVAAPEPR